ncbi:MAG: SpoIID/LytB domain-containing protein [Cyanobacteria bacterium P01_F01_bin.4]
MSLFLSRFTTKFGLLALATGVWIASPDPFLGQVDANAQTPSSPQTQTTPPQTTAPQAAPPQSAPPQADIGTTPAEKKASSSRVAILMEPFIEADAIAIGKWLVTQKLQALTKDQKVAQSDKNQPPSSQQAAAPKPGQTPKSSRANSPQISPSAQNNSAQSPSQTSAANAPAPEKRPAGVPNAPPPPAPSDKLTIDSALEMRVALVKGSNAVSIATSNGGAIVSLDGEGLKSLGPGQAYGATLGDNGLTINGEPVPGAVWVQADNGYVAVGDRWYRGRVLLLVRENGLYAINYVMLNEYLYSVVGAEMSASWPIESLKAQAVAARSYALVHNVRHGSRRDYDLDDTTRYQAYKGVMTEANTTQAAVQTTAGEYISHNGGIVESLYAATQDIVNDAHSGYGMSQMGALDLAKQGYQYYQILGFYYPQTAVGRLDVGE